MQLAYLPDMKREYLTEDDSDEVSLDSEVPTEECSHASYLDEMVKDCKKTKRRGMLGWLKPRVRFYLPSILFVLFFNFLFV